MRTVAAAAALLLWAAAVRAPFATDLGEDELFYAIVAGRWLAGLLPYVASFDVKPPGLFAVFAAVQAVFGTSLGVIKGLESGCVGLTAIGLWLIGRRHLSAPVGWFAAALYPIYSLTLSGVNAPTELVRAPFEVFAVLALLEALGSARAVPWMLAGGVLLGAAGMVKQTTAFPTAALLAVVLWRMQAGRWRAALVFGAGMALVPLGFAAGFAAAGAWPALLAGAVTGAAGRLGGDNIGFGAGLLRFMPGTRPLLVVLLAALLAVTRWGAWWPGSLRTGMLVALAWLAGEAAGIIATRSMYDHYFLALVPPLLLVAGAAATNVLGARAAAAVVAASVLWPAVLVWPTPGGGIDRLAATGAAQALAQVPPGAPILVANRSMLVYLLAGRGPGTRYIHPQHLLCDFPAPDADPLAVALQARPAAIVVADLRRGMVCERDDRRAELLQALDASYCLAAHVDGAFDSSDVYVRRSEPWARCAKPTAVP